MVIESNFESEHHMRNPPIWKDWIGLAGMVITISVVFVQGGRILESQDNMRMQLTSVVGTVANLKEEASSLRTALAMQVGTDALHAEQIRNLNEKVAALASRR